MKLVWALIGSLIAAYGIARLLSWMGEVNVITGLMVGILAGFCFVLTMVSINASMESRPGKVIAINVFYNLIGLAIADLILRAWR